VICVACDTCLMLRMDIAWDNRAGFGWFRGWLAGEECAGRLVGMLVVCCGCAVGLNLGFV